MVKKFKYEDVKGFIEKEGYLLKDKEYPNGRVKLNVVCPKGHSWGVRFPDFKMGRRCFQCAVDSKRKTIDTFKKEVFELEGDDYLVVSNTMINNHTKITIKHNTESCGYEYKVTPNSFLNGTRCPSCFGNTKRTLEEFKKEVYELEGDNYKILSSEMKSNKSRIKIKHNIEDCGYEYITTSDNFLQGRRCRKCAGLLKKTIKEIKKEIYELVKEEYEVLSSDIIGVDNKIKIKHNINNCGHERIVRFGNFKKGSRCPMCKTSKGEKKIIKWLSERNIDYIHNKKYSNECKCKIPLRFDFQIFNKSVLVCMVEYDGIQHYKPLEIFGGEEGFKGTQKRDQIKNDYCKKNNIPLIRISYKQFDNIETILEKELTALGVIGEESIETILV